MFGKKRLRHCLFILGKDQMVEFGLPWVVYACRRQLELIWWNDTGSLPGTAAADCLHGLGMWCKTCARLESDKRPYEPPQTQPSYPTKDKDKS